MVESGVSSLSRDIEGGDASFAGGAIAVREAEELSPSLLFEIAYEEYADRLAQGEDIDLDAFLARFPAAAALLRPVLQVHSFLRQNPTMLADEHPQAIGNPPPKGNPVRWPTRGETFLGFHLLLELGRGNFARVFLATEAKLGDRLVAIKIAPRGSDEAKILAPIVHPNIVGVLTHTEDESSDLTAISMPYVGSATLCDLLAEWNKQPQAPTEARIILDVATRVRHPINSAATPSPARVLRTGSYVDGVRWIGAQLAEALAHVHARHLLHLDLKPSNVLLSPTGVPMLLDFNLAANPKMTAGRFGGTLDYMSPEQLQASELDARADVFSLGVLMYQLLTGKHPFDPLPSTTVVDDYCSQLLQQQKDGPTPLREANPAVDRRLACLIESCLRWDPAQRPTSMMQVARALRTSLEPMQTAKRWIGRFAGTLTALGFAVVLAAALSAANMLITPPASERAYAAGTAAYQKGRFQEAVVHFNEILKLEPNRADVYFARARAYQQMATPEMERLALEDYRRADKLAPDGRTKACMGYCLARLGQNLPNFGAAALHEEAIEKGHATAEVYNNLGYWQINAGEWKAAIRSLDKAIQLDNTMPAAYHNRALASLQEAMQKLPDLDPMPMGIDAVNRQTRLRLAINRSLATSVANFEKASALGLSNGELSYDSALAHALSCRFDMNKRQLALRHLRDAVATHGVAPSRLANPLLDPLRDDPAFIELTKEKDSPENRAPAVPSTRFLDPVRDHFP